MRLQLARTTLDLPAGDPVVMGILNIGRDSVADSRTFESLEAQVERGLELVAAGAGMIDIGVLSGRTDTAPISVAEEIELLCPLVSALAERDVPVSIDTWRAETIAAAVAAGASLINDTSGLLDPTVADIAAETGAGLVLMHTRAAPKQRHFPTYEDPVRDVIEFLAERIALATERGVALEQILLDPGLDYAKAPQQSIEVLRHLGDLAALERPVLLAVSRKYFIGMLSGALPEDRLAGTIAALEFGVSLGAQVVRVHDVAQVAQYLRLRRALHGDGEVDLLGRSDDDRLKWIAPK
ncbi:MAG TPA: dihydropteroate synthase [Solirubrobacteraceae bacterium]|nr:dihydropteroate synthase [Solirubrobacteraceae bacterium]